MKAIKFSCFIIIQNHFFYKLNINFLNKSNIKILNFKMISYDIYNFLLKRYFLDIYILNYSFVFLNTLFIYNCYSILSFVSIVNKL